MRDFSGMQDAAGDQPQDEFTFADKDRVARIMAALIAGDDIEPIREQIDNFSFTLISPLGPEDDQVSHLCPNLLVYRQNPRPTGKSRKEDVSLPDWVRP